MARSKQLKNDSFDYFGIREAIKPWGERIGEGRFETEGEWRRKLAGRDPGDCRTSHSGASRCLKGLLKRASRET
jgi:hypothetical protein